MKAGKEPNFINDFPIGEDLFEGKSHESVVKNIIGYISENPESKKRVIGIEGEWGSGKSNVIEILKKQTAQTFHLFTFDTWGHQEDLTRRTFLEELTDDLIENKLLKKSWEEGLKDKLATNVKTSRKEIPKFNSIIVFFGLFLLLCPLLKSVFEYVLARNEVGYPGMWSMIWLTVLGIVILGAAALYERSQNKMNFSWRQLLYVYQGNQIQTDIHETITSLEPSVREFRAILGDIVKDLQKPVNLVFVFDNMDRLPVGKVKEIWSSIHTFFAEVKNNNFKAWVLIPYDQKHICKVFSDDVDDKGNELTVSYIQKTFSIVFRISPPILSDWKNYFASKYKEAFHEDPPPQEQLLNLFDYLHTDKTIKPRQIITYINNLVALRKQWGDQIPLKYCALFVLNQEQILEDPMRRILDKSYVEKVKTLFADDTELEKYISALVFNVAIDRADEVLLGRSMEMGLRGEYDFAELAKHPAFLTVLDTAFYSSGTEINLSKLIESFDKLPAEIKAAESFNKYWYSLRRDYERQIIGFPEAESLYKLILINLPSIEGQTALTKQFLKRVCDYSIEGVLEFRGNKFTEMVDRLVEYMAKVKIEIDVLGLIPKTAFESFHYIDFVRSCKSPYNKYNVTCNPEALNDYLISMSADIGSYADFLSITMDDYNYARLLAAVEDKIDAVNSAIPEFKASINSLLKGKKVLQDEKPFPKQIPADVAFNMFIADVNQPANADLVFSALATPSTRPKYISEGNVVAFLNSIGNIDNSIEVIENYLSYGDLILIAKDTVYPRFMSIVRAKTIAQQGQHLVIKAIIENYDSIKTNLLKDDIEYTKAFIENISRWKKELEQELAKEDFTNLFSVKFIADCGLVDNDFTKLILSRANMFVENATENDWTEAFKDSGNSYLFSLTMYLIEAKRNSFSLLSEHAANAYKTVIQQFIDAKSFPDNIDEWDILLDFIEGKRLIPKFKDIRDRFIYSADGVSEELMTFLEKGLFKYAGLDESDKINEVVRKGILPLIKGGNSFEGLMSRNRDMVVKLISSSPEELKLEVEEALKAKTDKSETLLSFVSDCGLNLNDPIVDESTESSIKEEPVDGE